VTAVPAASPVPREARPYQGHRAGLVSRGMAAVVDGLVVVLVLTVSYLGLNGARFVVDPRSFSFVSVSGAFLLAAGLVVATLYLAGAWAGAGRSYGCHVLGLRVVDRRGRKPGPLVALARAGTCVIFPIGLAWCAVGAARRSLQDLLLGTCVI
jgi:uncharacterized RDD family membrane protein YckC